MRRLGCLLTVALSLSPIRAEPPEVAARIEVPVGQLRRIDVTVPPSAEIGFQLAVSEGVFFDELVAPAGVRRFVFQASRPGSFPIAFWTRGETTGTVCTVVVGGTNAGTNSPPVTVTPANAPEGFEPPLLTRMKEALAKDVAKFGVGERDNARKMAKLFADAAKQLEASTAENLTVAKFHEGLAATAAAVQLPKKNAGLNSVRELIPEMGLHQFSENTLLTGSARSHFVNAMRRFSRHLAEAARE